MKVKLITAIILSILSQTLHSETVLGVGANASPNGTALGQNATAYGYSGSDNFAVAPLGAVALGIDSTAFGNGIAIGNSSLSTYTNSNPLNTSVAIGNNSFASGNGVALGSFSNAQNGTVDVGGRTISSVSEAVNFNDAVNLQQVQSLILNMPQLIRLEEESGNFTVGAGYIPHQSLGDISENATPIGATRSEGLNVNIGENAGQTFDGSPVNGFNNLNLGTRAGADSQGNGNIAQGFLSGTMSIGDSNIAIGNGAGASQIGNGNISLGDGAGGYTTSQNAIAIGSNSSVDVDGGIALGSGAAVTPNAINSVALGQNSVATEANTVSVGSIGNERRINNVADPINDMDAVNLRTLRNFAGNDGAIKADIKRLDSRINKLQKRAFGGTALALAMSGAAPDSTHDASFSIGTAIFNDQGALAANLQLKNIGNNAVVGLGFGMTTQKDVGVRASITWQWNPSITKKVGY